MSHIEHEQRFFEISPFLCILSRQTPLMAMFCQAGLAGPCSANIAGGEVNTLLQSNLQLHSAVYIRVHQSAQQLLSPDTLFHST